MKNIVSENLTDAVVKRLVGHTNVVYYNCEINAWNTSKYNGFTINGQDTDTKLVKEFKSAMEKMPEFNQQYEFAASVTMTMDKGLFPGWGEPINNPQYYVWGTAVVGNIIVKNKVTGKYELYCKSWVGVNGYDYPNDAIDRGAFWFADCGVSFSDFRANLIAAHTHKYKVNIMTDKDIVIDGVRYKLLPADRNQLQAILSRATVVKDDKTPQVKSAEIPVETEKVTIITEKRMDEAVKRLIGHTNVVYYNCEINAWNTNKYNQCEITSQGSGAKLVKEFKSAMEKMPEFNQQYEFAAPVSMTIDADLFPGYGEPINNPRYCMWGTAVVGNIIVKNKATGKYELYCKSWIGAYAYCFYVSNTVQWLAIGFARNAVWSPIYCAKLIAAHTR